MGLELDSLNPPENAGENNNGNQGPIMGNVAAGQRGGNAHQNQQGAGGNANNAGGNNANAATTGGNANNEDDQNNNSSATDVFYTERYVEARAEQHRDSLFSRNHMTYVEEKAVFCKFRFSFLFGCMFILSYALILQPMGGILWPRQAEILFQHFSHFVLCSIYTHKINREAKEWNRN